MNTDTNIVKSACYEQALVAVLCEIQKKDQDIDAVCASAIAGVIGNALYNSIGTDYKGIVIEIINEALIATKEVLLVE
jgi:hypothetical protein